MKHPSESDRRGREPKRRPLHRLIRRAWLVGALAALLGGLVLLTISQAQAQQSNNANLSNLEWRVKRDANISWNEPYTFRAGEPLYSTTFSTDQTSYSALVFEGFRHLKVRATAAHSGAMIEIGKGASLQSTASGTPSHAMALNIGWNTINVKVTAQDGVTTKTYVTSIFRQNRAIMYVNGTVADLTVMEGSTATVRVSLVAPDTRSHTFTLYRDLKTAEPGDIGPLGSITIPAGSTSGSRTVSINEDDDTQSDVFELSIDPPYEVHMSPIHRVLVVTIRDNDGPNQPRDLQVAAVGQQLKLTWGQPAGSTGPSPGDQHDFVRQRYSLTGYEVQYKEQSAPDQRGTPGDPSSGWTVAAIHFGFKHARTIRAVKPGTAYDVRVRGLNRDLGGAWATAQATTPGGPAGAEPSVLWSTTLTIKQTAHAFGLGCWTRAGSGAGCDSGLAAHRFSLDGASFEVRALIRFDEYWSWSTEPVRVYDRSLRLVLNRALPNDRDLRLRIGGAEYPVSGVVARTWGNPDFFWRVGDQVPVSLVEVAPSGAVPSDDADDADDSDGSHAALIAQIRQWRNDPCCVSNPAHTGRWDRTLLTFGETVSDQTLEPMTASEAQTYADRGWVRWEAVVVALRELEAAAQLSDTQPTQTDIQPTQVNTQPTQTTPVNQAPVVSVAPADAVIVNASGTRTVSLAGAFRDPDGDALTVSALSSNEAVAAVTVGGGGSSLTVQARSRGAVTITLTADDGNGGTVEDAFTVTVKAAPLVASALADVTGLEAGTTRAVSLAGVFRDPDGDALTITASSSNQAVARVTVASGGSGLTVIGAAEGAATISVVARDSDGNQVSDEFTVSVEPEPRPASTLTGIVADYDANGDGSIDLSEYRQAVRDYTGRKISYAEMFKVLMAYRSS